MAISLAIEKLEAEMILAEPIRNRFGQVLLNKGVSLSARHLTILKTWGIPQVLVENGTEGKNLPEMNEEIKAWALARLKKRFSWTPDTGVEEELIQLALLQAAKRAWI
jgi:hypothetical protein